MPPTHAALAVASAAAQLTAVSIAGALEVLAHTEAAKPVPRAAYFEALQDAIAEVRNVINRQEQQRRNA